MDEIIAAFCGGKIKLLSDMADWYNWQEAPETRPEAAPFTKQCLPDARICQRTAVDEFQFLRRLMPGGEVLE